MTNLLLASPIVARNKKEQRNQVINFIRKRKKQGLSTTQGPIIGEENINIPNIKSDKRERK